MSAAFLQLSISPVFLNAEVSDISGHRSSNFHIPHLFDIIPTFALVSDICVFLVA